MVRINISLSRYKIEKTVAEGVREGLLEFISSLNTIVQRVLSYLLFENIVWTPDRYQRSN